MNKFQKKLEAEVAAAAGEGKDEGVAEDETIDDNEGGDDNDDVTSEVVNL